MGGRYVPPERSQSLPDQTASYHSRKESLVVFSIASRSTVCLFLHARVPAEMVARS